MYGLAATFSIFRYAWSISGDRFDLQCYMAIGLGLDLISQGTEGLLLTNGFRYERCTVCRLGEPCSLCSRLRRTCSSTKRFRSFSFYDPTIFRYTFGATPLTRLILHSHAPPITPCHSRHAVKATIELLHEFLIILDVAGAPSHHRCAVIGKLCESGYSRETVPQCPWWLPY